VAGSVGDRRGRGTVHLPVVVPAPAPAVVTAGSSDFAACSYIRQHDTRPPNSHQGRAVVVPSYIPRREQPWQAC
jgi:hypothetical protein